MEDGDLNKDGKISDREVAVIVKKMAQQRKMSWTAIVAMLIVTGLLFSPFVTAVNTPVLSAALPMFYIAMTGIVAAYTGAAMWLNRK
jgi:hypothetical protein